MLARQNLKPGLLSYEDIEKIIRCIKMGVNQPNIGQDPGTVRLISSVKVAQQTASGERVSCLPLSLARMLECYLWLKQGQNKMRC